MFTVDALKGALKSFTMWFGAFLLAWPELAPEITKSLMDLLGENAALKTVQVIGLFVMLLRLKTNNALSDKVK